MVLHNIFEFYRKGFLCKGRTIIFFTGRSPFLGLADNFFPKNNAFQTIFFITFCNENNFFTTILKTLRAFL